MFITEQQLHRMCDQHTNEKSLIEWYWRKYFFMENLVNMNFHFTLNYLFLPETTDVYSELLMFTPNYWFLLWTTDFYSGVLIFSPEYWYLLRSTDFYSRVLIFTAEYWFLLRSTDF